MPRTQKKVEPIEPTGPTLDQVVAVGLEYEALKAEEERIAAEIERKAKFLKAALVIMPGQRVRIGDRDLGLVPQKPKEHFDLESAEKRKALFPLLQPYVETKRTLDLESARKHLREEQLSDFITTTDREPQLKFLKAKAD